MLEMRSDRLETWSGPGQAEAFALSQQQLRADLAGIRRTQDRHSRTLAVLVSDVAELKTDVAALRSDMAEMKGTVLQILARLPER
jgi:hypothetical protein